MTLVSICLIPGTKNAIGRAAYLGAITTVFGHPGRRFGQMAEALMLAVGGTLLGVAWGTLGVYLGSLVIEENPPAAYTVRGVFLALAAMLHGYLRSRTPRLFVFVLLLIICSVVSLVSTAKKVTTLGVTQILYPILIAAGVIVVVNVFVFPEFSSEFLGQTTIETLDETAKALVSAGEYFVGSKTPVAGNVTGSRAKAKVANFTSNMNSTADQREDTRFVAKFTGGLKSLLRSKSNSSPHVEDPGAKVITIGDLTADKAIIRSKVSNCKAAQSECNFELAFSVLAPAEIKPIGVQAMKRFAANVIAVIGTCESKYALLGDEEVMNRNENGDQGQHSEQDVTSQKPNNAEGHSDTAGPLAPAHTSVEAEEERTKLEKSELERIKPRREIEFGDARLLQYLQRRIADPYHELQSVLCRTVDVINTSLAFAYGVPKLPSGTKTPKGIVLEELDMYKDILQRAAARFDVDCADALEGAAAIQDIQGLEPDIMPREEIFLISSFVLNVRQAVSHIETMLDHSYILVSERQQRHGRRRLYLPEIKWASWLTTGGEEEESLPSTGRKPNRKGGSTLDPDEDFDSKSASSKKGLLTGQKQRDLEKNTTEKGKTRKVDTTEKSRAEGKERKQPPKSRILRIRGKAADILEWIQDSEDLLYAFKLAFALLLVLWPAFVARWNAWFSLNRGIWAGLQLVFITEVSIGTSVMVFILRAIGTTLGCLWGWAAYEARNGNRIVCAAMVCIGIFPCAYVQLGTKYPKAGMVGIVSMCVVTLATELETVPGGGTKNFLKRYIAFMIGGIVALVVEVVVFPVKARTRLVEALVATVNHVNDMEKCIAFGIEEGKKIDVFDSATFERFEQATNKANNSLTAAETFLPFCSTEPRLKGSFEALTLIYGEMIFVLHQIIDRMENMLQLRTIYGSGPLEELNAEIYPYRRNVAGSVTLTLFAIQGALMTKTPLPQFLPSARLAHLRIVNRVREVVLEKARENEESKESYAKLARLRAVRRKYMAWNASSAAQAEIVEFLEELIDLTKLLIGANEFNSGLLTRENYREYVTQGHHDSDFSDPMNILNSPAFDPSARPEEEESMAEEGRDVFLERPPTGPTAGDRSDSGLVRRRKTTSVSSSSSSTAARGPHGTSLDGPGASGGDVDVEVPPSLKRIQTRKIEAGLRKQKVDDGVGPSAGGRGERNAGTGIVTVRSHHSGAD